MPSHSHPIGEAVKIRAVKEAEAEASRTEIQAKADAEAKFLGGQGISRQRQAIMEGLRESVNAFKNEVSGVDAKTVMDLMIVTQYFDMMKDVGAQGKTNGECPQLARARGASTLPRPETMRRRVTDAAGREATPPRRSFTARRLAMLIIHGHGQRRNSAFEGGQ